MERNLKHFWNWLWKSDSLLSWIVAFVLIYVFIKLLFLPGLGLIMGNSLPLAGVESSSMNHQIVKDDFGRLNLCGNNYLKEQEEYINFDKYWETCGDWYEKRSITKEIFFEFPMKNGFKKGDIIITWGRFKPMVGDIIIFKPNSESSAPRPIIHRIVQIEDGIIQTKGDHNEKQLISSNNFYKTDETNITEEQIIGKAIFKIPYLGWVKILFVELINKFTG